MRRKCCAGSFPAWSSWSRVDAEGETLLPLELQGELLWFVATVGRDGNRGEEGAVGVEQEVSSVRKVLELFKTLPIVSSNLFWKTVDVVLDVG